MSDFPNGRPPGQNNLDATAPAYVDPSNDPSAMAQKPDDERPESDGIEAREDDTSPEVRQELQDASRNYVQPSTAEEPEEKEETGKQQPAPQQRAAPAPARSTTNRSTNTDKE